MAIDVHQLGAVATAALKELAANPPHMTNKALRASLALDAESYEQLKETLVLQGLVIKGVGAGGTLRLATSDGEPGSSWPHKHDLVDPHYSTEESLYEPMRTVISSTWSSAHNRDLLATQITAHVKSGATGTWSHPDITSVEFRKYTYVPGTHLDVVTYEVKPAWEIDVRGVYEALAHSRAATRSTLLLHVPFKDTLVIEPAVATVCEAALAHGIGVVTAADPADAVTWTERVSARRRDIDPEHLDAFLTAHLTPENQRRVAEHAHRISMSQA